MFSGAAFSVAVEALPAGTGGASPSSAPGGVLPGTVNRGSALPPTRETRAAARVDELPDPQVPAVGVSLPWLLRIECKQSAYEKLAASHPCGADAGWFVSRETRRQWPARCKKLTCGYCLPREASLRQLILAESWPDTMWSQTMVCPAGEPDPWKVVRYRMNLFFGFYRRKAPLREMSYVVEMNPQKTGYHIHALCHGPAWDIDALVAAQKQAGLGLHGNQWAKIGKSYDAAGYGLKGFSAAGYGLKGFTAESARQESLRINGGRLEHHTRGFIRVNGKSCTIAVARKHALEKKYGKFDKRDVVFMRSPVGEYWFDAREYGVKHKPQSLLDDL